MKYLRLLFANLWRKKTRAFLTLGSIAVAFLLFGLLQSVSRAFESGAENAQADRMITNSRYSIIDLLPVSYTQRIAAVPGVESVAHATWFGGSYDGRGVQFAVFPVVPEDYLKVAPELLLSDATKKAWLETRTGAIVGESLAKRMGWQVGQKIPLTADIWPKADGSLLWEFDLVGTFKSGTGDPNAEGALMFRYDYFDEARQYGQGEVGWFTLKIADPAQADAVAKTVDTMFANSEGETKTQTEKAFTQGFVKQFGDIGFIVTSILGAVFFTILVLTGNTMMQAMRERIPELGILKTLGFSNRFLLVFTLAESILIALLGGFIGLALATLVIGGAQAALSSVGVSGLDSSVVLKGLIAMILLGLATGLFPALKAMRVDIVDALRG